MKELISIICSGKEKDLEILAELNSNSKKVLFDLLWDLLKKKLKFKKGKREIILKVIETISSDNSSRSSRVVNYKSKVVKLRDIIKTRPLLNLIISFIGINPYTISNGYRNCFNGFRFVKYIDNKKYVQNCHSEFMANIHIWMTNLLENYPKTITINMKKKTVKSMILCFKIRESGEIRTKETKESLPDTIYNQLINKSSKDDPWQVGHNEGYSLTVVINEEFFHLYNIYRPIVGYKKTKENYEILINEVFRNIGYSAPETLKISIAFGFEKLSKEFKSLEEVKISLKDHLDFKKSKWFFLGKLDSQLIINKDIYNNFDFIGFNTVNYKPIGGIPLVINEMVIWEMLTFPDKKINKKYDKIKMDFYKEAVSDEKIEKFMIKLLKPKHKDFFNSDSKDLESENDLPRIYLRYNEDQNEPFFNRYLFGGDIESEEAEEYLFGGPIGVYINPCYRKGKCYPCNYVKETRKVLIFMTNESSKSFFIDEVKSVKDRKIWEKIWDMLEIEMKRMENAFDKVISKMLEDPPFNFEFLFRKSNLPLNRNELEWSDIEPSLLKSE